LQHLLVLLACLQRLQARVAWLVQPAAWAFCLAASEAKSNV
jgi:hypothetical protein